jgi:hypothetical protein
VEQLIRQVAPRILVQWPMEAEGDSDGSTEEFDPHDVPAVFARYLERGYAEQPELRARLSAAFAALWSETDPAPVATVEQAAR